ncbi:hypothetical protein ALI144C_44880 [Actinosynnema sp. ALI-1.44]|nr:hypothetical protein ALI144C_44880 [Actinosynnema sp. ALI-1.44]
MLGSTTPRQWTKPLVTGPLGPCGCGCALTEDTSYGFDVAWVAERVLKTPLDPWERWLVIHAGELLPDGTPRFRHVLVIVARQNGKTYLLTVLALFWLFTEKVRLVVSMSTNLDYAKEAWEAGCEYAVDRPQLKKRLPARSPYGIRRTNGQQQLTTKTWPKLGYKGRWKIAASNRRGGRSLSIARLILDELREHDSWEAWSAAVPATNAVPGSQVFAFTNMGDDSSVVLDSRRASSLSGEDPASAIFEWSAPEGSRADDLRALAMSNPNLGRRIHPDVLLGDARAALAEGGEQLAKFLTEILCIRIRSRKPGIDAAKWADQAATDPKIDLAPYRNRTALCLDVSLDGQHVTLCAAAVLPDEKCAEFELPAGTVALEAVAAWDGPDATLRLRRELPGIVAKVKPRALGWLPGGPAAAITPDIRAPKDKRRGTWPPRGVVVEEIKADTPAACMGLAEQVRTGMVVHPNDDLINAHVLGAQKLARGNVWVFSAESGQHVDGAYAAAGAVHLARTLPPSPPPLAVL